MQRDLYSGRLWTAALAAVLALLVSGSDATAQWRDKLKSVTDKGKKVQEATKPMTVEQEQGIGREVAAKAIGFFHLYSNSAVTKYVNMVGATVAAQSERQDIQYHFAVLDSDNINAISAPGGYVFITRGALALCGDESELAGVLAHEVGHIAGKHVVHILERDKMMRAGMDEASAYVPGSDYLQKVSKNILVKLFDQGLAPDDEFDADARGVKYAHAAGYPADGLERFLTKLDQATNQGANSFWVRTHPPVNQRNPRIQKLIAGQHWEDTDRPRLAERFAVAKASLPKPKAGS
jgi:predicted Zn-dependent protease